MRTGALTLADLLQLEHERFGDPESYAAFVRAKHRRPTPDGYAAFQPFNESTQSLLPLVPLLRTMLRPGDVILDNIRKLGAGLVVIGTHRRRGWQHLMLGSVAERILRTSPVPVLTVGTLAWEAPDSSKGARHA